MGLFRRRQHPKIQHERFGILEFSYRHRCWSGSFKSRPDGTEVFVQVPGTENAPAPGGPDLIFELETRYSALCPQLAEALFRAWTPYSASNAMPAPRSPAELFGLLALNGISITEGGDLDLLFAFESPGIWDDAMFSVVIRDWRVTEARLDD